MFTESSKTVCLTGCTRGLGRALVDEFVATGWKVAGCGRSSQRIEDLRKTFPDHLFFTADTTDGTAVQAFAKEIVARFGAPHLLLNNAAVINPNAPLWKVPPEDFSSTIDVNIKGVYQVIRSILPSMLEARRGVVVNFSSGWGRSTSPEVAPYCATKWAIEGLTQALSQELPQGLAAVTLNPGIIDTEMLRSCFGKGAGNYPTPAQWAKRAAPFLMRLGPQHNGQALTAP